MTERKVHVKNIDCIEWMRGQKFSNELETTTKGNGFRLTSCGNIVEVEADKGKKKEVRHVVIGWAAWCSKVLMKWCVDGILVYCRRNGVEIFMAEG